MKDIDMMFKFMEYDELSSGQHDLIIKFEERYKRRGWLTEPAHETLQDIFDKAAGKVEWSR